MCGRAAGGRFGAVGLGAQPSRERLRILVLEPYYGGSHKRFLDVLIRHSRHDYRLITLPARKWKWRMRGAAIWFAERLWEAPAAGCDLILTCDMVGVADLRALLPDGWRHVPILCYFHENQLTYPLEDETQRDYQYGFTNITSCLAADRVWFNSASHRDAFLTAADELLGKMPDYVPPRIRQRIAERSEVQWPVVDVPAGWDDRSVGERAGRAAGEAPTMLWNHRWEYDKAPQPFFDALLELANAGVAFRIVLAGESFRESPPVFDEARRRLGDRVAHVGFVPDRAEYFRLMTCCDLVVSTAIQENFGFAVAEAVLAGCRPLLPDRLSYPELIPPGYHDVCLYTAGERLAPRLARELARPWPMRERAELASKLVARIGAENRISLIDNELCSVARTRGRAL